MRIINAAISMDLFLESKQSKQSKGNARTARVQSDSCEKNAEKV